MSSSLWSLNWCSTVSVFINFEYCCLLSFHWFAILRARTAFFSCASVSLLVLLYVPSSPLVLFLVGKRGHHFFSNSHSSPLFTISECTKSQTALNFSSSVPYIAQRSSPRPAVRTSEKSDLACFSNSRPTSRCPRP